MVSEYRPLTLDEAISKLAEKDKRIKVLTKKLLLLELVLEGTSVAQKGDDAPLPKAKREGKEGV